jgi:hypothetical protein
LTWDASSGSDIVGYNFYYGALSRTYTNEILVGSATSVTVTDLVAGTTYYFAVTAYDSSGGESAYSDEVSYTVPMPNGEPTVTLTSPPDGAIYVAPAALNLVANVAGNGHTITEVDFYSGGTLLGQATSPPYLFTWTNVPAGTFSLTAHLIFDSGSTVDSAPTTVKISTANSAPVPSLAATFGTSVSLAWDPNPAFGNAVYIVYYGPASRNYTYAIPVGSATNLFVTGLVAGTTYYFAVAAYNGLGLGGDYSDELTYTVPLSNLDPTIALTSPADGADYVAPAAINLVANVVTNGHTITEVDFYNGGTMLGQVTSPPYVLTWTNASAGTFSLTARLIFDFGSTIDSAPTSIKISTDNSAPAPFFVATSGTSVSLAWDPNSGSDNTVYTVCYGTATRTYTNGIPVGSATNVFITNLVAGTTYYLAVTAYDIGDVEGAYSDEISYTVPLSNPDPTIALTSPANGAAYVAPPAINLVANVVTNGHTVTEVDFYNSGTLLGQVTSPPYLFTWTNVSVGTFSLTARLNFDSGSIIDSLAATIHVLPPLPTLQAAMTSDGQLILNVSGQPGQAYDVLASQDLSTWTVIGAVTLDDSGAGQFVDPASLGLANRVYRLQQP